MSLPATTYKPGNIVPTSGQYSVTIRGRYKGQVTCVKGEPFPPCKQKGARYCLTDRTRHRKAKG